MASTYSTGGLEIMADGEKAGSWGEITSNNLQILERMASVAGSITLSGTTHTLTISDGSLSDGHYGVLVFGGSPSGTNTVTISPNDAMRVFMVLNSSGESIVLTQGSGGNVTVADGVSAIVYCDGAGSGAEVVDLTATFAFQGASATLAAISGLAVTDGNIIVGNGSTWVAENGATARTSLGAGTLDNIVEDTTPQLGGALDGQGNDINNIGVLFMSEQASAEADVAGDGQWWVQTATPNIPMFTNDAGTDFQLATLTGTETLTNKTLTAPAISNPTMTGTPTEDVYDFGTPGAAPAVDPANGSIQTMTLSENATPTDSMSAGESITLMVNDGSSYTVTWTSLVDEWRGGEAPTLPTSGYAVIVLWKVGSTVYAAYVGDMSAP